MPQNRAGASDFLFVCAISAIVSGEICSSPAFYRGFIGPSVSGIPTATTATTTTTMGEWSAGLLPDSGSASDQRGDSRCGDHRRIVFF